METAYAQALWRLIQSGKKPKEAVHALHEMLVRLGRVSLLPKIGRVFLKLAQGDQARNGITLSIAREGDERAAHKAIKDILGEMNVDGKEVATRIDETLIGGWRLEGKEMLVDASFKKQLLDMYTYVTNPLPRRAGRGPDPAGVGV